MPGAVAADAHLSRAPWRALGWVCRGAGRRQAAPASRPYHRCHCKTYCSSAPHARSNTDTAVAPAETAMRIAWLRLVATASKPSWRRLEPALASPCPTAPTQRSAASSASTNPHRPAPRDAATLNSRTGRAARRTCGFGPPPRHERGYGAPAPGGGGRAPPSSVVCCSWRCEACRCGF